MADNRTILQKAQLTLADMLSDGGLLPTEVARTFIKSIIKKGVLVKKTTVRPMKSYEQKEPKIKFGSRVLHPASGGVSLPDALRSKPSTDEVVLSAKEFKTETRLGYDVLEDNAEGSALLNTVMGLLDKAIARDMDDLMLNSDTTSDTADYTKFDGLIKLATSNLVDAAGSTLSKAILSNMQRTLPTEYLDDREKLHFLVSANAELDYRHELANRATAAGDTYLTSKVPVAFGGSPVMPVPTMPQNLGITENRSVALYCDPKNILTGVWRDVKFETDKDISAGEVIVVGRIRWCVAYNEEESVVKASDILVA